MKGNKRQKKGKKEKEKNPEIIIKVKLTLENSSKLDKLSKMVEFFLKRSKLSLSRKKEDMTRQKSDVKRIAMLYYEQLHANKFANRENTQIPWEIKLIKTTI